MKTLEIKELYDKDYYTWTQEMARALSKHQTENIDFDHLAEEISDLGKAEKRALKSQLERLIAHLLKWTFTDKTGHAGSWYSTIQNAREEIQDILDENPGLKPLLKDLYKASYRKGVSRAGSETNQYPDSFPNECPWTIEQAMDLEFFPEQKVIKNPFLPGLH